MTSAGTPPAALSPQQIATQMPDARRKLTTHPNWPHAAIMAQFSEPSMTNSPKSLSLIHISTGGVFGVTVDIFEGVAVGIGNWHQFDHAIA